MSINHPQRSEPSEDVVPEGAHAQTPKNTPSVHDENDSREYGERVKELEGLKKGLKNAFVASMKAAVSQAGIQAGHHEVHFSSGDRITSHLLSFDEDPQVGPYAAISVVMWEPESEDKAFTEDIVSIDRIVFFDKKDKQWKVYRSQMLINDEHQRKGIGSRILSDEEDIYKDLGISEVLLKAGEPVGLYNNAKEGFDFVDERIRDHYNQEIVKRVLTLQKEMGVVSVTLGERGEELMPIKRIFSAPELCQLHAYTANGEEVLLECLRPKKEKEQESISDQIAKSCYQKIGRGLSEEARKMLKSIWNGDVLLGMKNTDRLRELAEGRINYTRKFLESHQLPGANEAREVLDHPQFIEVYQDALKGVSEEDFMTIEKFPLGKALFLDMRPKNFQSYWYGKKSM